MSCAHEKNENLSSSPLCVWHPYLHRHVRVPTGRSTELCNSGGYVGDATEKSLHVEVREACEKAGPSTMWAPA